MKTVREDLKARKAGVFSMGDNQCIWMKAGVINFKLCDSAYNCSDCAFDKAMSRMTDEKPESSWRNIKGGLSYDRRECRHMLTGRAPYHFCSNNYQCNSCEYDQYLDEVDLGASMRPVHTVKVAGFEVADGYHYHKGHSWARIEHGGFVRVGIDDFAYRLLGCPTKIHLPRLGSHLEQTEMGWSIQKGMENAGVLAPVKGIVVATNQAAAKNPEAARKDPYGQGWLVVVEPQGLRQSLKKLLFDRKASAWIKAEAKRLEERVMSTYGMDLAATGGEIVDDILGNLPHLKWKDIVHEFLLT